MTYLRDHTLPAIYTQLTRDGVRLGNGIEFVSLEVNGPVHFYIKYTQNNSPLQHECTVRLMIKYKHNF